MSVAGDTAYLASGLLERIEPAAIMGFTDGMIIGNLVDKKSYPSADTASWQVFNRGTHKLDSSDPGAVTDGTEVSASYLGSEKKTVTLGPTAVRSDVYHDTIRSSVEDPSAKVGQFLGNSMASYVDKTIAALFDDFNSGNDVGTSSAAISIDHIFKAVGLLNSNYAPVGMNGLFNCVLDPLQINGDYGLMNDVVTSNQFGGSPDLQNEGLKNAFIRVIAGVQIYQSRELPSDSTTEHWGAVFSPQAIGYAYTSPGIYMTMDDQPTYQRYAMLANHFFGVVELDDYWGCGVHTKTSA